MSAPGPGPETDVATGLALDVFHEMGNLLAAVRLQAGLVDESLGPRGLAEASLEIDELCARAHALLAALRLAMLAPRPVLRPADPEAVADALSRGLEGQGAFGVRVERSPRAALPRVRIDAEVAHDLLWPVVLAARDAARPSGCLRLGVAAEREGAVALTVEDDAAGESSADGPAASRRGRPLVWALVRAAARRWGASLDVDSDASGTRARLRVPVVDPGA